jgi:hypothetical protein
MYRFEQCFGIISCQRAVWCVVWRRLCIGKKKKIVKFVNESQCCNYTISLSLSISHAHIDKCTVSASHRPHTIVVRRAVRAAASAARSVRRRAPARRAESTRDAAAGRRPVCVG